MKDNKSTDSDRSEPARPMRTVDGTILEVTAAGEVILDPIFTIPQLAKYAQCSPNSLYDPIYEGRLKAFMLNPGSETRKNWRVYLSDWVAFTRQGSAQR